MLLVGRLFNIAHICNVQYFATCIKCDYELFWIDVLIYWPPQCTSRDYNIYSIITLVSTVMVSCLLFPEMSIASITSF
jgi:hypothetical protein